MTVSATTDETDSEHHDLAAPHSGGLREHMLGYFVRVRGGETGSLPALGGLMVLIVFFSVVHDGFLTAYNLEGLIAQSIPVIVMAMGLIFVLLLGEIDLSAGTTGGLTAAFMAVLFVREHLNLYVSIVAAIITGIVIGFATGWLRAKVGIPSFVITLATFLGFQGITVIMVGGQGSIILPTKSVIVSVEGLNGTFMPLWAGWALLAVVTVGYALVKVRDAATRRRDGLPVAPTSVLIVKVILLAVLGAAFVHEMGINRNLFQNAFFASSSEGLPYAVLLSIVLFVIWNFVLNRTRYGRHVYAVGGNAEAARRAGIAINRVRISVFVICSAMAAVSGLLAASLLESVQSDAGSHNTLLLAVGAAVIGGTSLFGGRGRIIDAVLGGLVVSVIQNGMSDLIHGANSGGWQEIVTGLVLLIAAGFDAVSRRTGAREGTAAWRPVVSTLFLAAAVLTVAGIYRADPTYQVYAGVAAVVYVFVAVLISRPRAAAAGEGAAISVGVVAFAGNLAFQLGIGSGTLTGTQAVTFISSLLVLAGATITVIIQYSPVRPVVVRGWLLTGVLGALLYIASEFVTWVNYRTVGDCCSIPQDPTWVLASDVLFIVVASGMLLWAGLVGPTRWSAGVYIGVAAGGLMNLKLVQSAYFVANGDGTLNPAAVLLPAGIVLLAVAGIVARRRVVNGTESRPAAAPAVAGIPASRDGDAALDERDERAVEVVAEEAD